jgi:ribosomal protein L16/L10AE
MRQWTWYKATALFIAILLIVSMFNIRPWRFTGRAGGILSWDVTSYYGYLPAYFIHDDLSLEFIRDQEKWYHNHMMFWPKKTSDNRYVFKVKGEKHSVVKAKRAVSISPEKLASITEFIEYACTENRLNQAIEQVFTSNDIVPVITQMGNMIKWMNIDIIKEETDTLAANGLEPREVNKYISMKTKNWFMTYLNKQAGLK